MKNIVSILLVFTLTNTVVGKTIHELFFHHHEIECNATNSLHFHGADFLDNDVICGFHFSSNPLPSPINDFSGIIQFQDYILQVFYVQYVKSYFLQSYSLRGPPNMC